MYLETIVNHIFPGSINPITRYIIRKIINVDNPNLKLLKLFHEVFKLSNFTNSTSARPPAVYAKYLPLSLFSQP